MGKRFSIAISWARKVFLPVIGNQAPAFTVASLATIIHCLPLTYQLLQLHLRQDSQRDRLHVPAVRTKPGHQQPAGLLQHVP